MRRLTVIVILLAGIYSAYWFIGSAATERAAKAQLDELAQAGMIASYSDLSTIGYPSRFDTTVTDLALSTADGQTAWTIPFVQALALAYKPTDIIFAFANSQTVTLGGVPLAITSEKLRASLSVAAATSLAPENLTIETGPLTIAAPNGASTAITNGLAATRLAGPMPHQYDAFLDLDGLTLPAQVRAKLDPNGRLPASFDQLTIDTNFVLDRAIDRSVMEIPPRPQQIALRGMTVTWGNLQLRGSGDLTVDTAGVPTGRLTFTAQGWQQMLEMAVDLGIVDSSMRRTLQNMGAMLAGGTDSLSIPLTFANGTMSVGPIPVGPAPRFY